MPRFLLIVAVLTLSSVSLAQSAASSVSLTQSVASSVSLAQSVAPGKTHTWEPSPAERGDDGVYRRTLELHPTSTGEPAPPGQPFELIVWAATTPGPGAQIRVLPGGDRPPIVRVAAAADPVPLAVLPVSAGDVLEAELACDGLAPVRFAWHVVPVARERREELAFLRGRLTDLASGSRSPQEACTLLLEELLGDDERIGTWAGSQLAREIGERAVGLSLHDLVVRAMRHAAAFREPLLPRRSKHVFEVRLMEARALVRTRRIAEARTALEEIMPVVYELHGRGSPLALGTRQDLASCLQMEGDLEGARDLYLECVDAAAERLPAEHFEHVRLRHNAAVACFELSDFWRSLQLDQEALARLRALPQPIPKFEHAIRLQLALTTRSLGTSVPDFEDEHRRVLAELETTLGATHVDVLRLKSNLAGVLADSRRPELALPLAQEVLEARLASLGPAHPETLFSTMRLAQVFNGHGDTERALSLQREALELCERTRPPGDPLVRRTRSAVVHTLHFLERSDEAEDMSLEWIEGLRSEVRSSMVASWRERRERVATLKRDVLNLTRFGERTNVGETWQLALFELIETARAASAAGPLRIGADEHDGDLRDLFEAHAASREMLGSRAAAGAAAIEGLMEARHELDAHERSLARALAERGKLPFRSVEARSLSRAIGPRGAVVGFSVFDAGLERPLGERPGSQELFFHVSLLTHDGTLRVRLVQSLCELEQAIARWRAAIQVPVDGREVPAPKERRASEREAGRDVLALVFGDWLEQLAPEVDVLHVCLEGALALVPLDALPWSAASGAPGVLGDRFRVHHLSSFDAWNDTARHEPAPRRLLALGGLEYGTPTGDTSPRFARLPGSAAEVRAVAELFARDDAAKSLLLEGTMATRETVRAELPRTTHALFATHGTFDDELLGGLEGSVDDELSGQQIVATMAPLSLSRLALSGANLPFREDGTHAGIWTGEELAGEDLRNLELVVLSACDTNRTLRRGGLGVLSLQSALHAAGAQRSLTSLWRVKTDYGRLLIERFFEAYLDGASASDALWQAKLFLREERRLPTRFWAGWTLNGDR
jgi:CHAT domain-containing protein/tetratricopeptide (TPR) repeat protein